MESATKMPHISQKPTLRAGEGENHAWKLSCDLHMCALVCTPTLTSIPHTENKYIFKICEDGETVARKGKITFQSY